MRVLLVEDDEGVASALAELLGQTGATVVEVSRGADALHRVKGCDLVLLDLGLPDMDGPPRLSFRQSLQPWVF